MKGIYRIVEKPTKSTYKIRLVDKPKSRGFVVNQSQLKRAFMVDHDNPNSTKTQWSLNKSKITYAIS